MIDTDKYEGHTPAPWMNLGSDANSLLMQDAPLLLAEVKRLREEVYNLTRANDTAWALSEVSEEEVMRLREKNRHLQDLLVKARGDCWECGMPLDSCDSHNCERQRQEDIELGMIE